MYLLRLIINWIFSQLSILTDGNHIGKSLWARKIRAKLCIAQLNFNGYCRDRLHMNF